MGMDTDFVDVMLAAYDSVGKSATLHVGANDPIEILVIPVNDMMVEYAEFSLFRAIASTVSGVSVGDTLDSKIIRSIKPFDDGFEIYIGVDK